MNFPDGEGIEGAIETIYSKKPWISRLTIGRLRSPREDDDGLLGAIELTRAQNDLAVEAVDDYKRQGK